MSHRKWDLSKTITIGELEHKITLPAKYEVCERCEGHGTHLNPNIGEHAYSAEEFADSFDEEEQAEYFRHGGMYDVTCYDCKGKRVVAVLDEQYIISHYRRGQKFIDKLHRMWDEQAQWDREAEQEHYMEAMMGGREY